MTVYYSKGGTLTTTDECLFWEPDDDDWNPITVLAIIAVMVILGVWVATA